MNIKNKIIIVLLIIIAPLQITPLLSQNNLPIDLNSNWEVWYDNVPVSAEIRVGIMADQNDTSINPTTFYVMIPKHTEKFLSCEISSRDGRYEASVAYDISKLKTGSHQFRLPTKHVNDLKTYNFSDITILTSISGNLENKSKFYTSASWKPISIYPENIYVYLNSERTTTLVAVNKSKNEREDFKCIKIENPSSIAYNKVCKIPSKELKSGSELYIKQRVRRMNKITYNSYPISIKLPTNENW